MNTVFNPRLSHDEYLERLQRIDSEKSDAISGLVALAGLDPSRDLRFGDLEDCRFDDDAVRGYDFTGCYLARSTFKGAFIAGAIFDLSNVSFSELRKASDFDAWLEGDLKRPAGARRKVAASRLPDLARFREAPWAPEMVVIPSGAFEMGSDDGDGEAFDDEKPKRRMRIARRFGLGRYPVTFEEYDLFCDATKRERPEDAGWGRERRPVINVSWDDANAYADWLNARLGVEAYGLPSEAQWEWACRAGTTTRWWWGDAWDAARANGASSFEGGRTSPAGVYPPNDFGLYDTTGNVWEWCADEWTGKLADLPEDGRPFGRPLDRKQNKQKNNGDSPRRAQRGGSWSGNPRDLRSAFRVRVVPGGGGVNVGFRLSRTL